jgi:hypothetical protein
MMSFIFTILGFGRFRHFFYLLFVSEVNFFTFDTLSQRACELYKAFSLENFARILAFSFTNQTAAAVGPPKIITTSMFDTCGERFILLGSDQLAHEITAIAVLDDGIVYATAQGNICRVEMVVHAAGPEFQLTESFSIGGRVTCQKADKNGDFFVGTESGMVAKMRPIVPNRGVAELYAVLARKATSLGRFQKNIERLARTGKLSTTRRDVCDTAMIRAFARMSDDEKCAVLDNADFTVEEAVSLVKDFECV